ncbi:MAG: hypothetical protein Q7S70_02720 [bacterium]|nr:hypothetical protein [bacterium]
MNNALTLTPFVFPLKIKIRLGINRGFFCLAAFVATAMLLAYYIVQVNSLTRERYLLGDYQERMAQFSRTNEVLEMNFSKTNSLTNADKYLAGQTFEKTNRVKYIQLLEDQVVRR